MSSTTTEDGVPIFVVFVEGLINEFLYPQNSNFLYGQEFWTPQMSNFC